MEQWKHFVQDLENRGASGVIFEDKVFPKNNSLALNKPQVLENPIIFSNKIQAAKEMVKSDDFLVIARIESLIAGNTVEDALYRAALYLEADADAIVIHSRNSNPKEIFDFSKKYHENFGKFKKP